MDGDGGAQNEPLSLIVIPPANDADVAAGLDTQLDVPPDSTLPSDNLSCHSHQQPTDISVDNDDKDGSLRDHSLIQIDSVKHEEEVLELNNGHAEMMEGASDGSSTSNDAGGAIGDDDQEYLQGSDPNEMKRVKVCLLSPSHDPVFHSTATRLQLDQNSLHLFLLPFRSMNSLVLGG